MRHLVVVIFVVMFLVQKDMRELMEILIKHHLVKKVMYGDLVASTYADTHANTNLSTILNNLNK